MGLFGPKKKIEPVVPEKPAERRALPRWKISAQAKIKWSGQNEFVQCEIRDLNLKGFAIIVSKELPQACSNIIIHFNEEFFFNAEISLVWNNKLGAKYIYGAIFTRLTDSDKEKMYRMMRQDYPQQLPKI